MQLRISIHVKSALKIDVSIKEDGSITIDEKKLAKIILLILNSNMKVQSLKEKVYIVYKENFSNKLMINKILYLPSK